MKKNLSLLAILILVTFFAVLLSLQNNSSAEFENGRIISLEVAKTSAERAQGLMNRDYLSPDTGMIFIFGEESILSFWMKDTLIPLDIIFLDKDKTIISIETMPPCEKDPCESYLSVDKGKYAIEVNAGFTQENNILVGQKVTIKGL